MLFLKVYFAVADVKLGRGGIEREINVLARLVTGVLDGLNDGFQRVFHALEIGRESAFVADGGAETAFLQDGFERVKRLGDGAQAFAERRQAERHDHEFLEIDRGIRVRAAVDDVGHRHGQHLRVRSAEISEERLAKRSGGGLGVGERDGEDGVRAELGFRFRAVELEHVAVNGELVERVHTDERGKDFAVHVRHGLLHAFAGETFLVAVAQFDGFVFAGAGAAEGTAARPTAPQVKVTSTSTVGLPRESRISRA